MRSSYVHDGLEFEVTEGGPSDGTPVLLLHGFPQRVTCWSQVTPLLHEAGLRTLAPDQRGYSPGARPSGRRPYRFSRLVADVAALAERAGAPVHLVGHDWGAAVAWGLARRRPDLLASLTALSVPHPDAMSRAMLTSSQALRSWYFGLFNVPYLVDGVVQARPQLADPALRRTGMGQEQLARFHAEIVDDGALPTALAWYRALPLAGLPSLPSLPGLRKPGGAESGRAVSVPTTFIWSTGDSAISRAAADRCEEHVTGSYRYVVLDGVSHWIPEEAPGVVAEAVLDHVGGGR